MSDEKNVEVERKWRLSRPPEYSTAGGVAIIQAYLITSPGELRIRSKGSEYFMTVKGEGTISRTEWEQPMPEWAFLQLLQASDAVIEKVRLKFNVGDHTVEVDIFSGALEGLYLTEVEWVGPADQEEALRREAMSFELPDFLKPAIEVTDDPRYKNKNLAMSGEIPPL